MGTVLEMMMIRTLISCALALGITASCTQTDSSDTSVTEKALATIGVQSNRAQLQDLRFAQQAQAGVPTLKFGIEDLDIVTQAVPDTMRDGIQTWLIAGGMSFSLQDGFLRSTRGLGDDLMAADIAQTRAAVLGLKAGQATRTMAYIGAEDTIEKRSFTCEITVRGPRELTINATKTATTLVAEDCSGLTGTFGNLYWVKTATGKVVQSRQWGSDRIGPIVMRIGRNQ